MKKIFGLAFSFLLILTLAACFGPSGNGGNETPDDPTVKPGPDKPNPDNPNPDNPNPDNPHECVFGNWEVVMESSCYKKGQEQRICKECGEIETRELDFAHEYTKVEALAPTCSTTGHTEYQVCLDCNDMIGYEEIPMVAHANTHWEKINDSYHSEYCDDCGNTTDKTNLNHNFDEGVKTEATCTEDGKTVYTCKDCGFSKEETIYAQGHTPGAEATCTTDQICTVCQTVLTEKTGHTPLIGSCDEDSICATCDTVLEEAKGHTSSGDASCKDYEYCTVCNDVISTPKHSYENSVCSKCHELQYTEGLEFELDFDGEYYYRVTGIKTSVDYIVFPNIYNGLPVKAIDAEAFMNDSTLEKVYIPNNIDYIGRKSFYNCSNLSGIFFEGSKLPESLGLNWNSNANLYFEGEYTVKGNLVELSLADNDVNRAYDAYTKLLNSLGNNYMLDYDHELDYNVGDSMNVKGSIDLNVSGDTIYAYETLNTTYVSSGYSQSSVTKTKDYYNDGYLYSNVIMQDNQTLNSKSYCTLPFSQVFDNNLTVDILNLTRKNIKYVTLSAESGVQTITITSTDGYTVEEFNALINYDKIPLNMDISNIMSMQGAIGTIKAINNTNTGELTLTLSLYGTMSEAGVTYVMEYTNTSIYSSIGSTPEQVCQDKTSYTLHNHNADINTCGEVTCKSCKLVIKEAANHTFTTQYCESNKCDVCGEVVKTGKTHLYQDDKCIYCGLRKTTQNLEYTLSGDKTYYILSSFGNCGSSNIVIPSVHEGLPVKEISGKAFEGSQVKSVFIPSSITTFGNYVFKDCKSLEELIIEDIDNISNLRLFLDENTITNIIYVTILNGTTINDSTFKDFINLEEISLPDTITSIGSYAFNNCTNLVEITIPAEVSNIGSAAFGKCTSLKEIVIPSKVTELNGGYSPIFEGCTSLEKVVLPETLTYIQYDTFKNTNIKELTVPANVLNSVRSSVLGTIEKIVITGSSTKGIDLANATNLKTVTLSDSISLFVDNAFENCTNLSEINIPTSITEIPEYCFNNCTSLTTITLPSSLVKINKYAFNNCSNLKTVNAGASLNQIFTSAFENCSSLEDITFDEYNLTYIGSYAFRNCTNLKELPIGEGLLTINEGAFSGHKVEEVTIPSTITALEKAFIGCENINKVYLNSNSVGITNDFTDSDVKEVIVGATSITSEAFKGMTTIEKATILDTVKTIKSNAFNGCTGLKEVVIEGNNLTSLDYQAFSNCTSLESITLPSSVVDFESGVFNSCDNLAVYYNGTIEDWLNVTIDYANKTPITQVKEYYVKDSSGEYFDLKTTKELVITRDDITKYQLYGVNSLEKISIPTLSNSLNYYFEEDALSKLKEVNITSGKSVINKFLYGISSIEKVTIGNTVTGIGLNSLGSLPNLQELTIPFVGSDLEDNYYYNFGYMFGATSYSSHATSVPASLKQVTITGTDTIKASAFRGCSSIEKIILPETIKSINNYAFADCSELKEINIPNTVTNIGNSAFANTNLTDIIIPVEVTSIGRYAFNCPNLTNVYYTGTIEDWTNITFAEAECNPMYYAEHFYLFNGENYEEVTSIIIPSTVENIETYQFYGFENVNEITVSSPTTVSVYAFAECNFVDKITLPNLDGKFSAIFGTVPTTLKTVVLTDSTTISKQAFENCSSIESIILNEGIITIEQNAFNGCNSITSFVIPVSVTSIGAQAFNCSSLVDVYYNGTLDEWMKIDMSYPTWNPMYYADNLYVHNGETYEKVEELVIPEGVTTITESLLLGFSGAKNITIPSTVTSIDENTFSTLLSLENVYYNGTLEDLFNITFTNRNGYVDAIMVNASHLYMKEDGEYFEVTSITVPSTVTTINDYALKDFTNLETLIIHDAVEYIGYGSFLGCSNLTSLTIPYIGTSSSSSLYLGYLFGSYQASNSGNYVPKTLKEVTVTQPNVPDDAFYGCSSIETINLSDDYTSIGEDAFYGCSSLKAINIPSTVTSIGSRAFEGCSSLTSIKLPEGLTIIKNSTFSGCSSLQELVIPSTVTSIEGYILNGCTSLTKLTTPFVGSTLDGTNYRYLSYFFNIGSYQYNKDYVPESLKTVVITKQTTISSYMFYKCSNLTSVTLADNTELIAASAFANCTNLTTINIPSTVTTIGESAFEYCSNLTDVVIPVAVTSIGQWAFSDCDKLTTIYCEIEEANVPSTWNSNWKDNTTTVVYGYTAS